MRAALEEYKSSKDATEAARCIVELAVPHYHHELVKQVRFPWLSPQSLTV
jgi:programmed cell death protein 4